MFTRWIRAWRNHLNFNAKDHWTVVGGEDYMRKWSPDGQRNAGEIIEAVRESQCQSVLDIGCGYGRYLKVLRETFTTMRLAGVEISATQLEQARQYLAAYQDIDLQEINGQRLPYPDQSFDLALTYGCLRFVPYQQIGGFIAEIRRVCRRGLFLEQHYLKHGFKDYLVPKHGWYQHDYPKLFRPHHCHILWVKKAETYTDTFYAVDFRSS